MRLTDIPGQLHGSNYQGIDSLEADLTAEIGTFRDTFAPEEQDQSKAQKNLYDSIMLIMMFAESLFFSAGMSQNTALLIQSDRLIFFPQ